jgi:hypothetical protein
MQLWQYCLLVTARLLYTFRTLSVSIIRSTNKCRSSHWCIVILQWLINNTAKVASTGPLFSAVVSLAHIFLLCFTKIRFNVIHAPNFNIMHAPNFSVIHAPNFNIIHAPNSTYPKCLLHLTLTTDSLLCMLNTTAIILPCLHTVHSIRC